MKKVQKKSKRRPATKADREVVTGGDFATAGDGLNGNRVFVSLAKTINLGNYESLRVEYGFGRTVNDGQTFESVVDACRDDASHNLKEMADIVEKQIK